MMSGRRGGARRQPLTVQTPPVPAPLVLLQKPSLQQTAKDYVVGCKSPRTSSVVR